MVFLGFVMVRFGRHLFRLKFRCCDFYSLTLSFGFTNVSLRCWCLFCTFDAIFFVFIAWMFRAVFFYVDKFVIKKSDMDLASKGLGSKDLNHSDIYKLSILRLKVLRLRLCG